MVRIQLLCVQIQKKIKTPKPKLNMFKNSYLSYSGTLMWNSIPLEIRIANTFGDFVKKCLTWMKDLYFLYFCSHTSTAEAVSMVCRAKMYLNIH